MRVVFRFIMSCIISCKAVPSALWNLKNEGTVSIIRLKCSLSQSVYRENGASGLTTVVMVDNRLKKNRLVTGCKYSQRCKIGARTTLWSSTEPFWVKLLLFNPFEAIYCVEYILKSYHCNLHVFSVKTACSCHHEHTYATERWGEVTTWTDSVYIDGLVRLVQPVCTMNKR